MRILFVTYGLPFPPHSALRTRNYNLIKNLSQEHSVLLLSLVESLEETRYVAELKPYCDLVDCVIARPNTFWHDLSRILQCLFAGEPIATFRFRNTELVNKIRHTLKFWDVQIVHFDNSFFAPLIKVVPDSPEVMRVLSFANFGNQRYLQMMSLHAGLRQKFLYLLKWFFMRRWQEKYAEQFDHCIAVSTLDARMLRNNNPLLPLSLVENGVDTDCYYPASNGAVGNTLLFVGRMDYLPNVDAVWFFYYSVMPIIKQVFPDTKLIVVGTNPHPVIQRIGSKKDVKITGQVANIAPYYQKAAVTIVPIRAGAGTRLQVLESMAFGRPVVSSSLGCEGLYVRHNESIMIANSPTDFAQSVIQLLRSRDLRDRISWNGRKLVKQYYDWQRITGQLINVYNSLVHQTDGENIEDLV